MSSLIQQLISDGSLVLYHDYRHRCAHDFSDNGNDGVLTDTVWTGRGISFPASTSLVTVPDSPVIRLTTGALVWFNDQGFRQQGSVKLISKQDVGGVNYELGTTPTQVTIYDGTTTRTLAMDIMGKRMIGVNLPPAGGTCEGFIDNAPGAAFSGVSTFTEDDADLILGNLYSSGSNFDDMSQKAMVINRQLTATEWSLLYGELSAMTAPTKVRGTTDDPLHKTDWGANQSAAAVSSGQLENTPFKQLTGSSMIVNDTLDGVLIKSIECVTNGTVRFPAWLDGLDTGWTGYVDTGSGYALTTLTLASLVYTMAAGDKIALSDRAGNSSIVKV